MSPRRIGEPRRILTGSRSRNTPGILVPKTSKTYGECTVRNLNVDEHATNADTTEESTISHYFFCTSMEALPER